MSDGIFNKFGLVDEMLAKVELLADAKGTLRCGLIWDVSAALKALKEGLKKEDDMHKAQMDDMIRRINETKAENQNDQRKEE